MMIRNKIGNGWWRPLLCGLGLSLCFTGAPATAQELATATQDSGTVPLLHVYTNLLQLPVLVLNPARERLAKPVDAARFSVSIDGGPWFRATHVHQQGNDPIEMAILLDLKGAESHMLPKIGDAISALMPENLHAVDQVSIYALGCSLTRAPISSTSDRAEVKRAVTDLVTASTQRMAKERGAACPEREHLWDAMGTVVGLLKDKPGRRSLLVISDGKDHGSKYTWDQVRMAGDAFSVAIFGMSYISQFQSNVVTTQVQFQGNNGRRGLSVQPEENKENNLLSLCELTGGTLMPVNELTLEEKMKTYTSMLRERYIVQFPRPVNGTSGSHSLNVRVEKSDNFVRSAGVTFPIQDKKLADDPNTIQTGPANAPEEGKKRPKQPK